MDVFWISVLMLALMLIRVPVAFSMGLAAVAALVYSGVPLILVPQRMFSSLNSFSLIAIPLFIFVGDALNTGGITTRIFDFCRKYCGHIRGGLGHVNVMASIVFAGKTGSAVSDVYGLGQIEIKAMREAGFDDDFSAAVSAASSIIAPVTPPSIPLVVYGVLAEQSIGRLFLGGVVPGLMIATGLFIVVYIISVRRNYPVDKKAPWDERIRATIPAIPALIAPILLLAGIGFGIITPTEVAALIAVYAIFLGLFIYRELTLKDIYKMFLKAAKNSAGVLIIIASANILTWYIQRSGVPTRITEWVLSLTSNKVMILLMVNVMLLFIGCFFESLSIIMLMTPILIPTMVALDVDLVHFGVFLVFNCMIGLITPPMGLCLFIICKIAEQPMGKVVIALLPFVSVLIVILLMITYYPPLVLWLPNLLMG